MKKIIVEGTVSGTRGELDYLLARALAQHTIFNNTKTTLITKKFVLRKGRTKLGEAEHYDDLLLRGILQRNEKGSISYYMVFKPQKTRIEKRKNTTLSISYCEDRTRSYCRKKARTAVTILE